MTESKHTPGPWVMVCRGSEGYCVTRSMNHIACRADMGFVADCTAKPFEESKANAEFIATAYEACRAVNPDNPLAVAEALPSIVEALRGLMWRFDDDDEDDNAPEETAPDILAARAALDLLEACSHAAISCHHPACKCHGEYSANPEKYCTCHVYKAQKAIAKAKGE